MRFAGWAGTATGGFPGYPEAAWLRQCIRGCPRQNWPGPCSFGLIQYGFGISIISDTLDIYFLSREKTDQYVICLIYNVCSVQSSFLLALYPIGQLPKAFEGFYHPGPHPGSFFPSVRGAPHPQFLSDGHLCVTGRSPSLSPSFSSFHAPKEPSRAPDARRGC